MQARQRLTYIEASQRSLIDPAAEVLLCAGLTEGRSHITELLGLDMIPPACIKFKSGNTVLVGRKCV